MGGGSSRFITILHGGVSSIYYNITWGSAKIRDGGGGGGGSVRFFHNKVWLEKVIVAISLVMVATSLVMVATSMSATMSATMSTSM